jgi:hypothetical protein
VDAVRASVIKALEQKSVVDVIQGLGATPEPRMSRQDFVDHHAKERARFAPLIKEIGESGLRNFSSTWESGCPKTPF